MNNNNNNNNNINNNKAHLNRYFEKGKRNLIFLSTHGLILSLKSN